MTKKLREGFTTGTAASAAAKAATLVLLGLSGPNPKQNRSIDVPLPSGAPNDRYTVPLHAIEQNGNIVTATVIKDGGDDPDATHKACILAHVRFMDEQTNTTKEKISLIGGQGVGRVTLPGLPVPPGEPAINPAPRRQIIMAVQEALDLAGASQCLGVTIEVPEGESIARKTMNPRLGIVGGISILGTRGTVRPFSHESWRATIRQGLSVARQAGLADMVFTTGGRSERFYREHAPVHPALGVVQAADFFQFSMEQAADFGFTHVAWSLFFGKLVKHAMGFASTHAADARIDFPLLARWFAEAGVAPQVCRETAQSITAMAALNLIRSDPAADRAIADIADRARRNALDFALRRVDVAYFVFDFDGNLLHSVGTWCRAR